MAGAMLDHPFVRRAVSWGFWVFFALSSVVCFVVALIVFLLTAPFDRKRRAGHWWSCAWASIYAWAYPGWQVRVTGRSHIAPRRPYVLVANHTSMADVVLMYLLFRQFKWVSKREIFGVPLLGWNMSFCRYIPLERQNPDSIAEMMEACRAWLRDGVSVLLFPEGTRAEGGVLKPFKHGAFTLAFETQSDVVPIAVHGGHRLLAKHRSTFAAKASLWVEVLPPLSPSSYPDASSLRDAARSTIERALTAR